MCDLVSVVIPVYNVEDYLDECLESVVSQTYKKLEIVVVNDGSTDNSALKCREWQERDNRIRFYSKDNEGLGPARNFGIEKATGKWIAFLDADDWYDLQFVEKMLYAANQYDGDMVTCNISRYNMVTKETSYMRCSSVIGIPLTRQEKLEDDRMGVVTKFSLRSLWVDNNIKMPNLYGEDFVVTMWILAVAKKIVSLDECLYFYRKGRTGSVSTMARLNRQELVPGTEYMISGFKRCGIFEENKEALRRYLLKNFSLVLTAGWTKMRREDYIILRNSYSDCYEYFFMGDKLRKVAQLGSYNLMQMIRYMPVIQDVELSFQFSSLISIVHPYRKKMNVCHSNPFREKMIQRDIISSFFEIMERERPQFLIFDLLEERHDLIIDNDGVITYSDAYADADDLECDNCILSFGTDNWWKQWKECAVLFMNKISNESKTVKLVMVENYLAETHGTVKELTDYENKSKIKETNLILKRCYDFLRTGFDKIVCIEAWKNPYYFTDEWFEYGVHPWHLNDIVNRKIANQLAEVLFNERDE